MFKFVKAVFKPDYLLEHFVWWDNITNLQLKEFAERLDSATKEQELQAFLEKHPNLLIQHLGGGHGRWVIPKKRLGSEHVTDFIIGERHSYGFEWQAVELESPRAKLFTKNGDISRTLNHAIRQITDWRTWLKRNQDYASRTRESNGLGLIDIDGTVKGLILLGREREINPHTNERRRQLVADLSIEIHTYDWILRGVCGRAEAHAKSRGVLSNG